MIAKTDDEVYEVYVSSAIKMYSYFSFICSTLPNKVLWKSLLPWRNGREEHSKFFGQSLLHPVVFDKGKNQVFWSSFGIFPLQLPDQLPYDCANLGLE